MPPNHGKRGCFPPEIIRHAIRLCGGCRLCVRDIKELLAERGVDMSHETLSHWFPKLGDSIAANLRKARARLSDRLQLDEMAIVIRSERYWL